MPDKQQVCVYVHPDLLRMTRHRAIDEDKSLSQLFEDALRLYLSLPDDDDRTRR